MKKFGKRVLSVAAVTAGVAAIGCTVAASNLFRQAMYRKKVKNGKKRHPIFVSDDDLQWSRFTPADSLTAVSNDGLTLHAFRYMQDEPCHKWIIVQHGYSSKSSEMLPFARNFFARGYNVLLPDLRTHGESGGKYIGWGYRDKCDIITWINEILKYDAKAEIVLFGHSLGAATVIMASGEILPQNVKCVIADSPFTTAYDALVCTVSKTSPKTARYIVNAADKMCIAKAGYSLKQADALEGIRRGSKPVLIIHGTLDRTLPCEMSQKLCDASDGLAKLVLIEGGEHKTCFTFDKYWAEVDKFLSLNM